MQLGRLMGVFLAFMGMMMAIMAHSMLNDAGFTLKFLTAGPALTCVGVAMIFFPGGNITLSESRNREKDPQIWLSEAPTKDKFVWIVAGVAGAIVSFSMF